MRNPSKALLFAALLAAFLLRSNAFAEQMYSFEELLLSPAVQHELELTEQQVEQIRGLQGKLRIFALQELMKFSFDPTLRGAAEQKQRAEFEQTLPDVYERAYKYQKELYSEVLLEFQIKRLTQIQLREAGTLALLDPHTQQKLNMTKGQVEQLKSNKSRLFEELKKSKMDVLDRAVQNGLPKDIVERLWNAIESGPRNLDYVLDHLTDEEIEKVEAMKLDYEAYVKQEQKGRLSQFDILTKTQRRKLEEMRGEKLETE